MGHVWSHLICWSVVALGVAAGPSARGQAVEPAPVDGQIHWIYRYDQGQQLARQTGRPLFVVFRCEKSPDAALFDARVVRHDDEVAELARSFVCVRIQSLNGLDLAKFPFERDLTWMALFLDGRDGIFARYGGREDADPESHLSKASLLRVMREVLRMNESGVTAAERPKRVGTPPQPPEEIPGLLSRVARRGDSCIRCHDVKDAELRQLQARGKLARDDLFTYPMPSAVGIGLDRDNQQGIRSIRPGSPAAEADVRPGDTIVTVGDRRVLTAGDMARALELTPKGADLALELRRGGGILLKALKLPGDWRETADPTWRPSVAVLGPGPGFETKELGAAEKETVGVPPDGLALRVTSVFARHPTPASAGLRPGDVIVEIDGRRAAWSNQQMLAHFALHHAFGDSVPIVISRAGKETALTLKLPGRGAD